jgi:diguanylate cyclase (GGDEF)-like protein
MKVSDHQFDLKQTLQQVMISYASRKQQYIENIKFLLFPSKHYTQQKYQDHRLLTIVVMTFFSILWPFYWAWDVTVDSVGASDTIGLRLLYLGGLSISLALTYIKQSSTWLATTFVIGVLVAEVNFIFILNHLENGMLYGLAGFMFCLFIAVLVFQCFSLTTNILYTLLATLLPHVAGLLNIAHHFPHLQYAALIWPAALLTIIAQTVQSYHYLTQYTLKVQLEEYSITDPLTGAKNRRYFIPLLENEIRKSLRSGEKLSLLMLDIDRFKLINDAYGHPTGDLIICNLFDTCHQEAREIDVVARLGGEEFAVLLTGTNEDQAIQIANRIRHSVAARTMYSTKNESFNYKISIGVAELTIDDKDARFFLDRADAALYEAKRLGRNRVISASSL